MDVEALGSVVAYCMPAGPWAQKMHPSLVGRGFAQLAVDPRRPKLCLGMESLEDHRSIQ